MLKTLDIFKGPNHLNVYCLDSFSSKQQYIMTFDDTMNHRTNFHSPYTFFGIFWIDMSAEFCISGLIRVNMTRSSKYAYSTQTEIKT